MKVAKIAVFVIFGFTLVNCDAQVTTDGSVGPRQNLQGPDYVIGSDLGTTVGNNLFQSFSQFNIPQGGSATFTGPANIQDVIARVTGGSASTIDGTLRLQGMPAANLWILNPAGVIFGASATLDIPASLYVGTGSYLVLGANGGHYDARQGTNSTLVSAPPTAFGFLGNERGSVTVENGAVLSVLAGREIAIASNNIDISGQLLAPAGTVSLAAVAGEGDARLQLGGSFDTSSFSQLGTLELSRTQDMVLQGLNNLDVSDDALGGGQVFIRSGAFVSDSGSIAANNGSDDAGGLIDIEATRSIVLSGNSEISGIASGDGKGGSINLSAPSVTLSGSSGINTDSRGDGDGGDIEIKTDALSMTDFASITSNAFSSGNGGKIGISATDSIAIRGTASVRSETYAAGNAGSIDLTAPNINVTDYGTIEASTYQGSTGNGGSINIDATKFTLVGSGQGFPGQSALVSAAAGGDGSGGSISIKADTIDIGGLSAIRTTAAGNGSAGELQMTGGIIVIQGGSLIDSSSTGNGSGGSISITGSTLALSEGAQVSAEATSTGLAGDVNIFLSDQLQLTDSVIATSATSSDGGSITISVPSDVILKNSQITTSVQSGQGNGGNISVRAPGFLVLESSYIKANAYGGAGGNINVTTTQVIASPDSAIQASSALGIQGSIDINAPDSDILSVIPLVAETYRADTVNIETGCGNDRRNNHQSVLRIEMDRTAKTALSGGICSVLR